MAGSSSGLGNGRSSKAARFADPLAEDDAEGGLLQTRRESTYDMAEACRSTVVRVSLEVNSAIVPPVLVPRYLLVFPPPLLNPRLCIFGSTQLRPGPAPPELRRPPSALGSRPHAVQPCGATATQGGSERGTSGEAGMGGDPLLLCHLRRGHVHGGGTRCGRAGGQSNESDGPQLALARLRMDAAVRAGR